MPPLPPQPLQPCTLGGVWWLLLNLFQQPPSVGSVPFSLLLLPPHQEVIHISSVVHGLHYTIIDANTPSCHLPGFAGI